MQTDSQMLNGLDCIVNIENAIANIRRIVLFIFILNSICEHTWITAMVLLD